MKALSLWEPWATLIARGEKTIEARTWPTRYRGPLLICAARCYDSFAPVLGCRIPTIGECRRGMAVAVAHLVECRPMRESDETAACCPCDPGDFAWVLHDVAPIDPFPVRGRQGLFDVDAAPVRRRA